jgi:hypothetical protein
MIQLLIKIYSFLLGLYPPAFRNEFREQMLLDFSDMVIDADAKGKSYLFRFCIREMFDFPLNLLRVHGKENKMLCSKSLNFGLRGAVGFGVVYTLTFQIVKFIYAKLSFIDDIVAQWQVSYTEKLCIHISNSLFSQLINIGFIVGVFVCHPVCRTFPVCSLFLGWHVRLATAKPDRLGPHVL